jgi:hypothetical protein
VGSEGLGFLRIQKPRVISRKAFRKSGNRQVTCIFEREFESLRILERKFLLNLNMNYSKLHHGNIIEQLIFWVRSKAPNCGTE